MLGELLRAHGASVRAAPTRRGLRNHVLLRAGLELLFGVCLIAIANRFADHDMQLAVAGSTAVALVVYVALDAARIGVASALALACPLAVPLLMVASTAGHPADFRLAVSLVGIGMIPLVLGTAPVLAMGRVAEGSRDEIVPALFASVAGGGVGVLVSIAIARALDFPDARLEPLAPYAALAMAFVALCEVLGTHRMGAGFGSTVVAIALVAIAVEVVLLSDASGRQTEDAVSAAVIAAGVGAAGLLVATAMATPRPLVVPVEEAAGGPRFVVVTVAALALTGAVIRLISQRPLWIDEATTARVTDASLENLAHAARGADAHPPLLDALVWTSRQVFGSSDVALRLPSLVAGVLLVPAVYVTAEKLFDRRVGLIAAVVVAIGPGFVWLSGVAQPGAVAALLTTISVLALMMAVDDGRLFRWVLFGGATALLLWSHQLAIVTVAALHVAAGLVVWRRRQQVTGWLASLAISAAALFALLVYRGGLGRADVLPPFEYVTDGAPGAGRSVFGLAGTALSGLLGFHPSDVTSRLLALWPLCMVAAFVLLGRSWSRRASLVAVLAVTPLVALLALQLIGAPRNPPFALAWTATAMPMLAIALARTLGLAASWGVTRWVALAVAGVLAVATLDQNARVEALPRYDIASVADVLGEQAGPGDVVVYAPNDVGDLVRHLAPGATVVPAEEAASAVGRAAEVFVVGAFAWRHDDPALDRTLALVDELAAARPLTGEQGTEEMKVWTFH
jgi:4-amino-4-deoxy-L-arabinose transferase-like glycosyltransferase